MNKMLIEDLIFGLEDLIRQGKSRITQLFGVAWVRNEAEAHNGIDIALPRRTILNAPEMLKTTRASYHYQDDIHSYGNRISAMLLDTPDEVELYLAHLDGIEIEKNELFFKGNFLARSGTSGSTVPDLAPHVHIGIRRTEDGVYLEPRNYIDLSIFERVNPDGK